MSNMLAGAFTSGTLSHPLQGKANSVELFKTLAVLSGARLFEETERMERLRSAIGHHDHYLFVLVDGLGMNLRDLFPPGGFFETSLKMDIRSVFPSTTSAALTSLATGLWPAEHGMSGWWTHFPEHRRIIAPLIFTERGTGTPATELGLTMEDLIPARPMLGSFFRQPASFMPAQITGGVYDAWSRDGTPFHSFRSHNHLLRLVRRDFARLTGPSYRYIYLLTVDKLCHQYGTHSDQVADEVKRVDDLLSRIRDRLPARVRMVVSADHGLVDVPETRFFPLRDEDPVCSHVIGGQTGEGRAPVFHVIPGHESAFLDTFRESPAGGVYTLHTPKELEAEDLYGPVPLSGGMKLHLGTYVGISTEPARLEYIAPGRERVPHIGVHGGLLPEEVNIPLFLA